MGPTLLIFRGCHESVVFFLIIILGLIAAAVVGLVMLIKKASASAEPYSGPGITPVMTTGWYPDPNDPTLERYFDGRIWTSSARPRA